MSKQFTLGNEERLKSRKLIEELFKNGKSFNAFPFRVFYLTQNVASANESDRILLQFGVSASTKNFKKAVDRNRIKRLTREAYRLQKNKLQETISRGNKSLFLFFVYTQKDLPDYETVFGKTGLILNKLVKLINETDSSTT
ncbi:MAG: ribonuclease P protein component [Chitinophagaceae bacterium]